MHCAHCGAMPPDRAEFCPSCGKPLESARQAPGGAPLAAVEEISYASFSERLAALILDSLLLGVFLIGGFLALWAGLADIVGAWLPSDLINVLPTLLLWLAIGAYFLLMESSERGATIGKRALRLRVVDGNGQRISKRRALVRVLGRMLSGSLLYIGYLIQPFNARKQALHDMLAGTLVVRTGAPANRQAATIIVATVVLILASLGYLIVHLILPAIGQGQLD